MPVIVVNPFSFFSDTNGKPLDSGSVYIGEANKDPESYPVQAYWDEGLSIPATQPLDTVSGYIVRSGTQSQAFTSADYSMRVRNKNGEEVFYQPEVKGDPAVDVLADLADTSNDNKNSALVGFKQTGVGVVDRTVQAKLREQVSVTDFYANGVSGPPVDPTGVLDSTGGFRAAFVAADDIDIPPGTYKITGEIAPSVVGKVLRGAGRENTKLIIPATFNLAAGGVFSPSAHSCEFHDFSIEFEQPDTAVRANLIAYPPAFKLTGIPGTVINSVRVVAAKTVFDMTGNTGQTRITDCIVSFFDFGAKLDGALDSVRFENAHFWPVGLTANQTAIMVENTTVGMSIGRADDLKGHGCLLYCGTPIDAFNGGTGGCFATFDNCDLDGFRGLVISGGTISFVGGFQSSGNISAKKLIQTGGIVNYSGVDFLISANFATSPDPWMSVSSGRCSFNGCTVARANFDVCMFNVGPTGVLNFGNNSIQHDQNIAYSYPFIYAQNGSRVNAGHNTLSDVGSGSAVFFQNVGDGLHNVCDNTLVGHTMSVSGSQGVFKDNGTASNLSGPVVIGSVQTLYFTGSLSGGSATVPHGVVGLQTKVLSARAFQKGGSGEAAPITVSAIDGTNVYLVGGTGTSRYRLTVEYIMTDQSPW